MTLLEDSLEAFCKKCSNYQTVTLMGMSVSGCACGIDPIKCRSNPLAQQLREQSEQSSKEVKDARND